LSKVKSGWEYIESMKKFEENPESILEILTGYWRTGILKAALELEVFTKISQGFNQVELLAPKIQASKRGVKILLDALCGLKLLKKSHDQYVLVPLSEKFLVKGIETYIGDAHHAFVPQEHWEIMGNIIQAVKKGTTVLTEPTPTEFWDKVVIGLRPLGVRVAQTICDHLEMGKSGEPAIKVLDLACGAGIYGFAVLQQNKKATLVEIDYGNVLEIAKNTAKKLGVFDRVIQRPGDILIDDFGEKEFDLAIISHILQGFGPEDIKRVLNKVHRALKPGGKIVIHDFVPDDNREYKTFPLIFAIYMLAVTQSGNTYTFSEFSTWLGELGFSEIDQIEPPGTSTLIIATRC